MGFQFNSQGVLQTSLMQIPKLVAILNVSFTDGETESSL